MQAASAGPLVAAFRRRARAVPKSSAPLGLGLARRRRPFPQGGPRADDLGPTTGCPGAHRLTACSPCDPVARDALPTRGECAADRPAAPPGSTRAPRAARRYVLIPTFSLKRKKHNCAVAPSNTGRWTHWPHSRGPSPPLFGAVLVRPRNPRRRRASAAPDDDFPSCRVPLFCHFQPNDRPPRVPLLGSAFPLSPASGLHASRAKGSVAGRAVGPSGIALAIRCRP